MAIEDRNPDGTAEDGIAEDGIAEGDIAGDVGAPMPASTHGPREDFPPAPEQNAPPPPPLQAGAPPFAAPAAGGGVAKDERNLGLFCHLLTFVGFVVPFGNMLGPLIVWLVKKDESAFVDHHGREALNFQINVTFWMIVFGILTFLLIGLPFLLLLIIADVVLTIIAALKASEGEYYTYPGILRLVK